MTDDELNAKLADLDAAHRERISQINRRFLIGVWIIIGVSLLAVLAPLWVPLIFRRNGL